MSEINMLHPFREGNGRTTREFIRLLALKCGYIIKWEDIPKDDLLSACISSVTDIKSLEDIIKRISADKIILCLIR
jgi:cell filamentation protein